MPMRIPRKAGVLVSSAMCGALVAGTGAAVAVSETGTPARSAPERKAPGAQLPGADALLGQAKLLGDLGGVTRPVNDLVLAVLQSPDGRLPAAEANRYGEEIRRALASVTQAPAVPPATQPAPGQDPAILPAYDVPGAVDPATDPAANAADPAAAPAANAADPGQDLKAKAVADFETRLDALLRAIPAGDESVTAAAVQELLTGTVNVVASVMVGGGLPAANLDGLPPMPQVPGAPQAPNSPANPEVPASPEVPVAPEAPASPDLPSAPPSPAAPTLPAGWPAQ
ncbi:hypothetical protein [Streptomyces sp. 8N616]|uniref:hypothetical protein n=1 Tax=Streptomyces sp. 8N616 TaxID=3457414 RepID=UPI003FD61114